LFSFIFVFLIWFLLASVTKPFVIPSPIEVIKKLYQMLLYEKFIFDVGITFFRIIVGFSICIIIAVPLGILIGTYSKVNSIFTPVIISRYIPPSVFVALSLIWFGIGNSGKIFIVFIANFSYLMALVGDAVLHVPKNLIETGYTLGLKNREIIKSIIVPFSLPKIFESIRFMFGVSWVYVTLAEMVGANSGIGHVIIEAERYLQTSKVFAAIIVIGIIGFASDYAFKITYKKLFKWYKQNGQ
jgi:NitT/TauT family transport system permease protein